MQPRTFADLDELTTAMIWADSSALPLGPVASGVDLTTSRVGEVTLGFTHARCDFVLRSEMTADCVQYTLPISPSVTWSVDGQPFHKGLVHLALPGEVHVARIVAGAKFLTIAIRHDQFVDDFRAVFGAECVERLRTGLYAPCKDALDRATRAVSIAFHLAGFYPGLAQRQGVADLVNGMLMEELVALTCTAAPQRAPSRSRAVRRFIGGVQTALERMAGDDVTLAALCASLHVSSRTLRNSFRAVYGTSPGRYLRLRRLWRARQALKAGDPARDTVADIALRHGFSDPGRFAAEYHDLFGEYPSSTLGRSLGRAATVMR